MRKGNGGVVKWRGGMVVGLGVGGVWRVVVGVVLGRWGKGEGGVVMWWGGGVVLGVGRQGEEGEE